SRPPVLFILGNMALILTPSVVLKEQARRWKMTPSFYAGLKNKIQQTLKAGGTTLNPSHISDNPALTTTPI
ncbi:hypothetical protein HAX54_027489, partial [Datura stramonium]|nr:hypothetical protein [Datura stramonium]